MALWRSALAGYSLTTARSKQIGGRSVSKHLQKQLGNLKMDDVEDHIGSAVHQNNVPSNQDVRAIRRWGSQPPFELFWTRLQPFLEARRERATPHELLFQTRWQPISLGKPWRKITLVAVVPPAHHLTVVMLIERFTLVFVSVLSVSPGVPVSVTLGSCQTAGEQECP